MAKKMNNVLYAKNVDVYDFPIEYVMTRGMYDNLISDVKGDTVKAAFDIINGTFGLLGTVTKITIEGD